MMRHSHNPNLSLHTNDQYAQMPVQTNPGPLIEQYLSRIHHVTNLALKQYPRTFAFRLDLRFPDGYCGPAMEGNQVIERFRASLKAKLHHNRDKARKANPHAHVSAMRYFWCREYSQHGTPHYHMVILLNNDAFCSLGQFQSGRDNMYNRLNEAWASALNMDPKKPHNLVHFPEGGSWLLQIENRDVMQDFFYRASYLAKAETKHYFCGLHSFGSSRG